MKNIHMFGISKTNGVKKHFFRPEKWHGFAPLFYYDRHTNCWPEEVRMFPGSPGIPEIFPPNGSRTTYNRPNISQNEDEMDENVTATGVRPPHRLKLTQKRQVTKTWDFYRTCPCIDGFALSCLALFQDLFRTKSQKSGANSAFSYWNS